MEHNSQDPAGSTTERPPLHQEEQQQQYHQQKKQQIYHHNLAFGASRNIIPDSDLVRLAARRPPAQVTDLPPAALSRQANKSYPLIFHTLPPFQHVNPAMVMTPTLEESPLNVRPANAPRLPIVTVRDFSKRMAASCRRPPRPPQPNPPTAPTAASPSSITTAVKIMPPPPRPSEGKDQVN